MPKKVGQNSNEMLESKTKIYRAVAFGLIMGLLAFIGAIVSYQSIFSNKVLYGVSVAGKSLAGLDRTEASGLLSEMAQEIESTQLTVAKTNKTTALNELEIDLDTTSTEDAAFNVGRESNWFSNIFSTFNLLLKPQSVAWNIEHNDKTFDHLRGLVESDLAEPADATFDIQNGQVVIIDEENGRTVDLETTLAEVAATTRTGYPTELRVSTKVVPAEISRDLLRTVRSEVQDIVAEPLVLSYGSKTFELGPEEIIGWLRPIENADGTIGLKYDEETLRQSIENVALKVDIKPVAKKISATDGSTIAEGKDGYEVDRDLALQNITETLSLRVNQAEDKGPVTLVVARVEPEVKKVQSYSGDASGGTAGLYDGKYIEIDLSSQTLYQYEGDNLIAHFAVSTGKWSTPTPIGTFSVNSKNPRAYSATFGLYMPYWMAFVGSSYGIHALPEWPSGYKEGEAHLGTPVSHGCVRLGTSAASLMYGWTDVGTPVVIHS